MGDPKKSNIGGASPGKEKSSKSPSKLACK